MFLALVEPLLSDLARGRSLPVGDWLAECAFFIIGLSLAMGLVSAARDSRSFTTAALDLARRRTFWFGVALLPVSWLLLAFMG